ELPRIGDEVAGHFVRLDPVNRLLHFFFEVLDAHAQAVEAHPTHGFQVGGCGHARIDFDADLRVGRKIEALAGVDEQIFDLLRRELRGRSAAPVELADLAIARDPASDGVNLFFQDAQVRWSNALILADDDV